MTTTTNGGDCRKDSSNNRHLRLDELNHIQRAVFARTLYRRGISLSQFAVTRIVEVR